jgi:hypothetical protein
MSIWTCRQIHVQPLEENVDMSTEYGVNERTADCAEPSRSTPAVQLPLTCLANALLTSLSIFGGGYYPPLRGSYVHDHKI